MKERLKTQHMTHNDKTKRKYKKRKTETVSRGTGYDSVKKYQYKEGLFCDLCQEELYRSTIKSAGIQHIYDAFSDSGKYTVLCCICARDADNTIQVSKLFPADVVKQISRLTHYLGRDSVELLGFFRLLERIVTGLELQQDITFGQDTQFKSWSTTYSGVAGNERLFLGNKSNNTEDNDNDNDNEAEYDDSNDDTEEAIMAKGFHLDDDE